MSRFILIDILRGFLFLSNYLLAARNHPCLPPNQFEENFREKIKLGEIISGPGFKTAHNSSVVFYNATYENFPLVVKVYTIKTLKDYREPFREAIIFKKFQELEGVAKFYGCQYTEKNVAIFIEMLGVSLFRGRKKFWEKNWAEKLKMLVPLTEAFSYFLKGKRVHSDIKPENIMMTTDGKALKIIDFGFSVHRDTRIVSYTPLYAAPEVVSKEVRIALPEQDVWGWVVTMILSLIPSLLSKLNEMWKPNEPVLYHPVSVQFILEMLSYYGQISGLPLREIIGTWLVIESKNRPSMEKILNDLIFLVKLAEKLEKKLQTKSKKIPSSNLKRETILKHETKLHQKTK